MLTRKTYQAIMSVLEKQYGNEKQRLEEAAKQFPDIPRDTLLSIYGQYYQSLMKQIHPIHNTQQARRRHYDNYKQYVNVEGSSKTLLSMSAEEKLSPALLARIILEQYIAEHCQGEGIKASQWLKNPHLITDQNLGRHIQECVMNDSNYGPLADNIKQSVGLEYEMLMKEKLIKLQVPFLDENELRERGYDKTPDFKLEVPLIVDGLPINWMESKASFGDDYSHGKYMEDQYWSYQNRFGPGLVVYWFGYIKELDTTASQGIKLADSFPSQSTITSIQTLYNT